MNRDGILYKTGVALGFVLPQEEVEDRYETIYGPARAPSRENAFDYVLTPRESMSLVGVYRAVSILTTAAKQLPMGVWRGGVEIDTPSLIKQPALNGNRTVFIEQTLTSLALHGNAYWRIHRPTPNEPIAELEVLNPDWMSIELNDAGKLKNYKYGDKTLQPWQVKHLSLLRIPGTPYGLGPVQAARASIRGAADLRNYSTNWFREGGTPNGILKTDHTLTEEQAAVYKERFEATQAAGRGVAVLGQGTTYQPIMLTPADAQFLESQQFTRSEIALLFGVPASFMLADGGNSMTYQNVQQTDLAFLKYTLTQYLEEIEQAFSDLLPRGQEARFIVEGFLRADRETRFAGHAVALSSKFMTVNEIREIEGLPPLPGGDQINETGVEQNDTDGN
jgi:HK97 family phage portal protein